MNTHHIILGDCIAGMKTLGDQSINTCVTSPPYFGLRDYKGGDAEIGCEASPEDYVRKMVEVFREVHRVLRDDGTLWLNLGDSYASNGCYINSWLKKEHNKGKKHLHTNNHDRYEDRKAFRGGEYGIKGKDLMGVPWRVAFALQADGWYLRQDIIWNKPNPMPESVEDRCTKSHEYIFLLSKNPKYYYDQESVKEPVAESTVSRLSQKNLMNQNGSTRVPGKTNGNMKAVGNTETRNRRSVWTVTTKPFRGAHFATFPIDLITPCILAGCPEGGVVLDPFTGSGTTAVAALTNRRNFVGCELNPDYAKLAEDRIKTEVPITLEEAMK
jgi:DNA modification methylase